MIFTMIIYCLMSCHYHITFFDLRSDALTSEIAPAWVGAIFPYESEIGKFCGLQHFSPLPTTGVKVHACVHVMCMIIFNKAKYLCILFAIICSRDFVMFNFDCP